MSYVRSTLNVSAVWLNPIYLSGNLDGGYDVKNYTEIDPEFGTMEEFRSLLHSMHRKGLFSRMYRESLVCKKGNKTIKTGTIFFRH